jgi:adenylate cyclase, class 2
MTVEIEAKMSVPSLDAVRGRLRERGAMPVGDFLETNTFFDTEDRSLLAADEGLRLRLNRNAAAGTQENVITYKGPRQQGVVKAREEIEIAVSDPGQATALLERLGYRPVLSFEKRRQTWKLDGCKVELDELPFLGPFVEVEGPDEPTVLKVRQSLGLEDRPIVKPSYVAMLMSYLQERGDTRKQITFADAAR